MRDACVSSLSRGVCFTSFQSPPSYTRAGCRRACSRHSRRALHLLGADLLVPPRVDEHVGPAHVGGVIDKLFLRLEIRRRITSSGQSTRPCRASPSHRRDSRAGPRRRCPASIRRRFQAPDDHHAPRRGPRELRSRVHGLAIPRLARIGMGNAMVSPPGDSCRGASRRPAAQRALADEHPRVRPCGTARDTPSPHRAATACDGNPLFVILLVGGLLFRNPSWRPASAAATPSFPAQNETTSALLDFTRLGG